MLSTVSYPNSILKLKRVQTTDLYAFSVYDGHINALW